jgi:LuxR family maltose regulon positive regulatory protein
VDDNFPVVTWLGWAKALPDELVRARPVLSVWYAYALLGRGEMEAAETRLRDAERWLEPADNTSERPMERSAEIVVVDKERFRSLPAAIGIARAYQAQSFGDVPGTVKHARRVLDLTPETDLLRRTQANTLLGLTYWVSGDLEAAEQSYAECTLTLQTAVSVTTAISAAFVLAEIRMVLGRLHEAARSLEQLLRLVVDQGEPLPPDAADLYGELSELYRERSDLDAAADYLRKGKELVRDQTTLLGWQYRLCVTAARFKQTQGDLESALDLLDEAERLYIRSPLPDVRPISALRARIWVAQGRLAEARGWARERGLSVDDDLYYLREFEHITLVRLLIARYTKDRQDHAILDAVGLLERLLQGAEEGGRMGSVIEILSLQALAHQAQGDIPAALTSLESALTLAEPEGYVRLFVDEGAPMAQLLSEAVARGILPDYTEKLLALLEAEKQKRDDESPAQPLIEPLSQRELEVLRLIAQGLSNREIAARLFVAVSTVKGHNLRIFGKLQVRRRTEAVARARELGLL